MIERLRQMAARLSPRSKYLSVFDDSCGSFANAQAQSTGYDDETINSRALAAATEVIEGRGAFERDGVVFTEPEPRMPVVDALNSAVRDMQAMRVLDIGGGLGSSFWQNKDHLEATSVEWHVVEREELITLARTLPEHPVRYRSDLKTALTEPWDAIVLSSVLQYLPEPHALLRQVSTSACHTVVIDRTPMHPGEEDIACIQRVPAHIYPGSYPAWILSSTRIDEDLSSRRITQRFPGIEPTMQTTRGVRFTWQGLVAVRESA